MIYPAEAKVGQIITFIYNGGIKPGTRRRVLVENKGYDDLSGTDLDINKTRCFKYSKMVNVNEEFSMPNIISGTQLKHGKFYVCVKCTTNNGVVVGQTVSLIKNHTRYTDMLFNVDEGYIIDSCGEHFYIESDITSVEFFCGEL